ncbi:MAG: site-specific integrase [Nitrospira sp.]|nr:site-specific integrase [Nitrospira sp.]
MTIGEFLTIYERNHVAFLKSSLGTSRRLQKYVGRLGHVELADLKRLQVIEWFHDIAKTDGPHGANLALQQLHAVYAKADDWELFAGKNPASRIKRFPKLSRQRFIQTNEMPYLLASIREANLRDQGYFLTLILTGCRRDEARLMQWKDVDLERGLWHKPTTKTVVPHTVPIPARLLELFQRFPRLNEWVFPSEPNNKNKHQSRQWAVTSVEHAWRKIRARVGLNDVRIHDLRRTTASWLAIDGANLPVIQKVLNHSSLTSTQVYARLSIEPVRKALDEQAERILGTLTPAPTLALGVEPMERAQEWPG